MKTFFLLDQDFVVTICSYSKMENWLSIIIFSVSIRFKIDNFWRVYLKMSSLNVDSVVIGSNPVVLLNG